MADRSSLSSGQALNAAAPTSADVAENAGIHGTAGATVNPAGRTEAMRHAGCSIDTARMVRPAMRSAMPQARGICVHGGAIVTGDNRRGGAESLGVKNIQGRARRRATLSKDS